NRLKIDLAFKNKVLQAGEKASATLRAAWLHGAPARSMQADVRMKLDKGKTRFSKYPDFDFEDPTRKFQSEDTTLFEDALTAGGEATINKVITVNGKAPGMLNATFATRVFESSGSFST